MLVAISVVMGILDDRRTVVLVTVSIMMHVDRFAMVVEVVGRLEERGSRDSKDHGSDAQDECGRGLHLER